MFTFNYKNLNSKNLGYIVETIPMIPTFLDGDNSITISFAYEIGNYEEEILRIRKLFNSTSGELSMSTYPNLFFYVINCSVREREKNKSYVITDVTFQLEPYLYHETGKNIETLATNKTLNNPCVGGNPLIKVFPNANNGSLILKVNSNKLTITNLQNNKYVIIDSELKECYTETGFSNNYMDGDFPIWQEYANLVEFTGQVSRIEIIPRWRS